IPLQKWLFAYHLLGGAKKGISSRQLARHLGITLKSAWHLSHRIRKTMTENSQFFHHSIVEADETYIGGKRKRVGRGYKGNKIAVMTIVERSHEVPGNYGRGLRRRPAGRECTNECPGRAQTMLLQPAAERITSLTVGAKLRKHTDPKTTRLMTDESHLYDSVGRKFVSHETVNHSKKEYARIDDVTGRVISTNAAEGLFGNLKRQINGTHHSTSKKHLPRYLEEYDYKYNTRDQTDTERTEGAIGKIGETKPVRLFKSKSGRGESLISTRQGERSPHDNVRGLHSKQRRPSGRKRRKW
ncbi:MAG: IS1595 family transposase, partial [Thermomicrobiales bacterium]